VKEDKKLEETRAAEDATKADERQKQKREARKAASNDPALA
jgi:hypothetical protein